MSVLTLENLSKSFGPVGAVRDINLSLRPGERTAIVGPSGCGKTTLLRLIAGFEAPTTGCILLDGVLIADATTSLPTHLRGIGLVAQDGALFPHLSVADNIGFGIATKAPDRAQIIADVGHLVGLSKPSLARYPHELSGGQQQRVALARAMVRKPRLMLLDEPFSSLDTGLRAEMRKAVTAVLAKAGIASILVTHDRVEALSYGDQIAVMHEGHFAQVGPPRALYRKPRNRLTAEFLGDAIILPATLRAGMAHCALGHLPVDEPKARDHALILLRPDQLHLHPCHNPRDDGIPTVEILEVEFGGADCSIRMRPIAVPGTAATHDATFNLRQPSDLPLCTGDIAAVTITGTAHVLDDDPPAA
ncbi:ABC transporter ATP-binding protein [Phaeovulum sp.]|uniref:ABC transporter ATP-binding protein n=1 Tax=Phaeovulum sp. TaxID=2934796 RepID=UPI0039E3643D